MPVATAANLIPSNNIVVHAVSGEPATYDQSGYEALTFTQIGALLDPGEFGPQRGIGETNLLGADAVAKTPGLANYGDMSLTLALVDDADDDGQALLKTEMAASTPTKHSIKIEFSGTGAATNLTYYAVAYVTSFRIRGGTAPNSVQATATFSITSAFVKVDAADT